MKKYSFPSIDGIKEFQPLTQKSGILLTEQGELYNYHEKHVDKINTPSEFNITGFYFRDIHHGIIIGETGQLEKNIQKGSLFTDFGIPLFLIICVYWFSKKFHQLGLKRFYLIVFLLSLGSIIPISCGNKWLSYKVIDESRPFITNITKAPSLLSYTHIYTGNKGLKTFVSITNDGGKSWETHETKTNFHLTSVTAIGKNYFVGSFANFNTSKEIPYHGDGDIFIYGTDTSYCSLLEGNTDKTSPFSLNIQRGVNGFHSDLKNEILYIFGSETEPQFPKDEVSTTAGNISQISMDLQSDYKIIDTPNKVNITSLSLNKQSDMWVTLDNKTPKIQDGYVEFKQLPTRKLLFLEKEANQWSDIKINDEHNSFLQVSFISNSNEGYILSEKNKMLFKTIDGGKTWSATSFEKIKEIKPLNNKMFALNELNEIIEL